MRNYSSTFSTGVSRLWYLPLITGLLCIAFGVWCLCSPATLLPVFAYIFAACVSVAGICNISYAGFTSTFSSNWGWSLALGLLEIVAGAWLFFLPEPVLTTAFIFTVGILILVSAINSIAEACFLSSFSGAGIVWMILMLLITIIFAVIFLSNPIAGGVAVWLWIGISLIAFGIFRIMLSMMLKRFTSL